MRSRPFFLAALLLVAASPAMAEVLEVRLEILPGCQIAPLQPIDFGTASYINRDIQVSGNVDIRCQSGLEYRWHFAGGDPQTGARLMDPTQPGSEGNVTYYFTRDAEAQFVISEAQPFEATGTGGWQTHPYFARLPIQQTPEPGVYQDRFEVVLTF